MLVGFRQGIKEGTYFGRTLKYIAMGIEFLDAMISQSQQVLDISRKQNKEMIKRAKEAMREANGKPSEEINASPATQVNQPKA